MRLVASPVIIELLLLSPVVRADGDQPSVRESALLSSDTEPLLRIDPTLRPRSIGLGTVEDVHERRVFRLGARTSLQLEGIHQSNQHPDRPSTNDSWTPERGWTASLRIAHDLGPFVVSLFGQVGEVDSQNALIAGRLANESGSYSPGRYFDVGITVGKSKKLSRWQTVWITITLGHRDWIRRPPAGEDNSTEAMVSVGTTFK